MDSSFGALTVSGRNAFRQQTNDIIPRINSASLSNIKQRSKPPSAGNPAVRQLRSHAPASAVSSGGTPAAAGSGYRSGSGRPASVTHLNKGHRQRRPPAKTLFPLHHHAPAAPLPEFTNQLQRTVVSMFTQPIRRPRTPGETETARQRAATRDASTGATEFFGTDAGYRAGQYRC